MKKMNQRGMTLVEILVALGISAGVALVGAQLMGEYYSNQNYTEVQAQIQREVSTVQKLLSNKDACNNTFRRFPISQTFNPPVNSNLYSANGAIQFEPRNYGKYALSSITISQSPSNQNLKNVNLTYSWPNKKFLKNHNLERTVSVFVTMNNTSSEWSCSEVVSDNHHQMKQELCNSLNDAVDGSSSPLTSWDPATGECKLVQFACDAGQVPVRLSSLGKLICADIKDVVPPNSLIDPAPVGCASGIDNISIEWDGTKYKLNCSSGMTLEPSPGASCSSRCDCPGMYDACIGGVCQAQSQHGLCTDGVVVKGDDVCSFRCSGGGWTCPYPPMTCPGQGLTTGGLTTGGLTTGGFTTGGTTGLLSGGGKGGITPGPGELCLSAPAVPGGHYLATCQCPEDPCPTYKIVPNGQFALCHACL